jgi:hypothetical protein
MGKLNPPWASGPGEILRHGIDLLAKDSDTNRRLAMISIDNAVELMIKTYLGLPKRVSGLEISRREFSEASESFPSLLDALEKHAADKLDGIELGEIEWYHRLRNQLYHQGNGLTVEREKVEIYAQIANALFNNLFGFQLIHSVTPRTDNLGEFMSAWTSIERGLRNLAKENSPTNKRPTGLLDIIRLIQITGLLPSQELKELEQLRKIRNEVVHGNQNFQDALTPNIMDRARMYARRFEQNAAG